VQKVSQNSDHYHSEKHKSLIVYSDIERKRLKILKRKLSQCIRHLKGECYDVHLDVQEVKKSIERLEQKVRRLERQVSRLNRNKMSTHTSQSCTTALTQQADSTGQEVQNVSSKFRHNWMRLLWESLQEEIMTEL
jgi:predicted RNase H-like nuclease (RuvC/YqgF family)